MGRHVQRRPHLPLDELERRYLEQVLAENRGDPSAAASASGIGRRYFNMLRAKLSK